MTTKTQYTSSLSTISATPTTSITTVNAMLMVVVISVAAAVMMLSATLSSVDSAALVIAPAAEIDCTPRTDWARYTLREGESLETLAHTLGISVEMLSDANCTDTDIIASGTTMYVPAFPAS